MAMTRESHWLLSGNNQEITTHGMHVLAETRSLPSASGAVVECWTTIIHSHSTTIALSIIGLTLGGSGVGWTDITGSSTAIP